MSAGGKKEEKNVLVESVSEFCLQNWLPISNFGQQKLHDEALYTDDPSASSPTADIKLDIALYTLFLKNLCEGISDNQEDRLSTLKKLPQLFSQLSSIRSRLEQSKVRGTERMSENEAVTLAYAITASTTTEALAVNRGVDPEVGFMFGLLRQLGLLLIAFNYPTVLREALAFSREGLCSLPEAITNMLGVSPAELGYRVLSHWELSEEVKIALTSDSATPSSEEMEILFDCSRTAEKLAQTEIAVNSIVSQTVRTSILEEIETELGSHGLFNLNQSINNRLFTYVQDKPQNFQNCAAFSINTDEHGGRLFMQNQPLQESSILIKNCFLTAYKLAEGGGASPLALATLTSSVIPKIGFTRGCLFIRDKQAGVLVPKLPFGDAKVGTYRPISLLDSDPEFLGILQALNSYTPIMEKRVVIQGRRLSHVSGKLQDVARSVVFLELDKELHNAPARDTLLRFGAVRQALLDFLNLSPES